MSPEDQKKRFLDFANQLQSGAEITREQRVYLQRVFFEMGSGRDANEALGLQFTAGKSLKDANARQDRSLVIHWMENAMQPEDLGGLGLSLTQAIQAVTELGEGQWINPKTKQKHTYLDQYGNKGARLPKYSDSTVEKIWKSKDNKHMRSAIRSALEIDSPYKYEINMPTKKK
jgi:hypothetical protein